MPSGASVRTRSVRPGPYWTGSAPRRRRKSNVPGEPVPHAGSGELGELDGEHALASSGAADKHGVASVELNDFERGGGRRSGSRQRAGHLIGDALRDVHQLIRRGYGHWRAHETKSTFFSALHGQARSTFAADRMASLLADAIAAAPPDASPWDSVAAALGEAGRTAFPQADRHIAARRRTVIAARPELQEREALKSLSLVDAMSGALQRRGVNRPVAQVVAQLGLLALTHAYEQWTDTTADDQQTFADLARRGLARLHTAAITS